MNLWPWRHKEEAMPDPEAAPAAERVANLEARADAAGESLAEFLRRRHVDPWASQILGTIHGARGNHGR